VEVARYGLSSSELCFLVVLKTCCDAMVKGGF